MYQRVWDGRMSKFIVIEGLIGVGKTSLCRLLEKELNAELVLEPAEDNPFLAQFYSDPTRFAFPAQMFYLATRCLQQNRLLQTRLFTELYVSDYLFAKDRIFAEQTLDGDELQLYNKFNALLSQNVAKPNFILFLDSPTDVIINRIKRRAIQAEQAIQGDYLDDLRNRYYSLWRRYNDAPVYVLNTEDINYIDNPEDKKFIIEMVKGWISGTPVQGAPEAYRGSPSNQLSLFENLGF